MCAFRGLRPLWPHPLAGIKASPSLLFSFSISSSALHERAGQQRSCNVGMFSYLNFIIDKSSSPGQLEFPPLLFFYSSSSRAFVSRIRRAAALWSRKGFSLNSIICNLYTFFYFTLFYVFRGKCTIDVAIFAGYYYRLRGLWAGDVLPSCANRCFVVVSRWIIRYGNMVCL